MKRIIILIIFCLSSSMVFSQETRKWYVPDHVKVQFAGYLGFVSVAGGYLHGNNKMETDIYLGYLPASVGGDHIISASLKYTYYPWKINLNENYKLSPFSIGSFLNYSFGSQFYTILPENYPKGYYWWATSLRYGAFIGGKLEKETRSGGILGLYYELGTYDLYFINWIQNPKTVGLHDIVHLTLGFKIGFK